jgi:DNA-binding MarR family transcriptional regulator
MKRQHSIKDHEVRPVSSAAAKLQPKPETSEFTDAYVQLTRMIERLHRRHLDVLRFELDRLGIESISAAQALMLTKIKDQSIGVRDLVERGYYLGSNASYNIKQLVDSGLVEQERSPHDRRSIRVKLSDKGKELCARIGDAEEKHAQALGAAGQDRTALDATAQLLRRLEIAWGDYLHDQGL